MNINDLLNIDTNIDNSYHLVNNIDLLFFNDIIIIETINTKKILKVFFKRQDINAIYLSLIQEENGYMRTLANSMFKLLKKNIKVIYRRNNIPYNLDLKFLNDKIIELENKIKILENK